ncbi:Hypothetical predicted protein [Octopus vulgaris]|uniref:Uncharacterized protein n=1 Tax=Octopus vulgaris TaxID=6645 RepID=A0AA36ALI7_OCTVU|nr:Hypothetical predicted protein [Octopus vulgaris]
MSDEFVENMEEYFGVRMDMEGIRIGNEHSSDGENQRTGSAEEEVEIGSIKESNVVNWKGYGVDLWPMATTEDIERFPFRIEIENEKTLSVIVEGRKPNCYLSGTRGHIRKECPLYGFTVEKEMERNETIEEEKREKEKEQEDGKNSALKEKETTGKRQEKGKGSTLKENEKESTGKERKTQGRETIENEPKKEQRQEKEKGSTQKEKETTEKTQVRETTDRELKRQEKEKKESKKREREKSREENKEEISLKRKTKENTDILMKRAFLLLENLPANKAMANCIHNRNKQFSQDSSVLQYQ